MDETPDRGVDQSGLDRRTRTCIWIILIGLANFVAYIIVYASIYGEAVHGEVRILEGQRHYFLHSGKEWPRWVFIYSGIHSISIWPTVGAVMLAMLTLAKDRIIMSAYSTARRGRAMITLVAVVIAIVVCVLTFLFARDFVDRMCHPVALPPPSATQPASQPVVSGSAYHRRLARVWGREATARVSRGPGIGRTPGGSDTKPPPGKAGKTAGTAAVPRR